MAAKNDKQTKSKRYGEYLRDIVDSIDNRESATWSDETRLVSTYIRDAVVEQITRLKSERDGRFLDYCNSIKSLLAIYNFGNLATEEALLAEGKATDDELARCNARIDTDKRLIKSGVTHILKHVKEYGFDITPYISAKDNATIFGDELITVSATTVMTTFVYFRRAIKRMSMFTAAELNDGGVNLVDEAAKVVAKILYEFTKYAVTGNYNGWGFTTASKAITLNDTYAVVDAISRYADAFTKEGAKADPVFTKLVDTYAAEIDPAYDGISARAPAAMYKVAYNIYAMTKSVFGQSIFYFGSERTVDNKIVYSVAKTSYEQIASSNRSSALFNPLYVAMITMYGYNEKEIVIRRFMDDYGLAAQYYNDYQTECDPDTKSLSAYAVELGSYAEEKDFIDDAQMLIFKHEQTSNNYGAGVWRKYYRVARVFQKYLETQLPDELMKIAEYRDYLNATKDAIDQVQVAYRNFDNNQRLGIVDTDYIMFSTLDADTAPANISKLNKAGISVNNLRPILLSSKIMIVNALVKYPQADMIDLYNAIKASRHRRSAVSRRGSTRSSADDYEWLWNEDEVDMNSTARHCEAITYDYFDYFERYELGLKAITNLKNRISGMVSISAEDGSLAVDETSAADVGEFGKAVLEISHANVDRARVFYREELAKKDGVIFDLKAQLEKQKRDAADELYKLECKHRDELAALDRTVRIGETVRGWIREESEAHLKDTLAYIILNNINGYRDDKNFNLDSLLYPDETVADGNFEYAHKLAEKITADYKENADAARERYTEPFKNARKMQTLFDGALDGVLTQYDIATVYRDENRDIEVRNKDIGIEYANRKKARRTYEKERIEPTEKDADGE